MNVSKSNVALAQKKTLPYWQWNWKDILKKQEKSWDVFSSYYYRLFAIFEKIRDLTELFFFAVAKKHFSKSDSFLRFSANFQDFFKIRKIRNLKPIVGKLFKVTQAS